MDPFTYEAAPMRVVFGNGGCERLLLRRQAGFGIDVELAARHVPSIRMVAEAVTPMPPARTRELLDNMKARHSVGGAIPGRPWKDIGCGLGLMIGTMRKAGPAFGHSGVGPDSLSAVYHFPECRSPCTVAAFTEGTDEGVNEEAVVELAIQ